jgi:hypothetical protein
VLRGEPSTQVSLNQDYHPKTNSKMTGSKTDETKRTTMTMPKGIMAGVHPLQVQKVLLEEQVEVLVAASSPVYGL